MINIIVAADEHNGIGKNNQLLWHLPADLKHFKQLTTGHPIIMGRKTYDSIGKALPGRRNIIISRQKDLVIEGCEVVHSLEAALEACANHAEIFIIGGAQIFKQALQLTDVIYFTRVHQSLEADTHFPPIDLGQWKETEKEHHDPDEKNKIPYTFITYRKR